VRDRSPSLAWICHRRLSWVVISCFLRLFSCFSIYFRVSLFRSSGIRRFAVLRLLQVCHVPPLRQASITSSSCSVPARSRPGFPPIDPLFFGFPYFCIVFSVFALVSMYLLWSPCICFGFPVFVLVFCYITFLSVSLFFGFLQFLPIFSVSVLLPSVHC
jgi:hypothetical protein